MEHKEGTTWDRIKNLDSNRKDSLDEEQMLSHLGVGRDVLDKLEEETIKSAMEQVKPKIIYQNTSTNPNLEYKYLDDSGMDLRADLSSPITVKSLERVLVPTGIHFELPESFEVQVRPRSGLAIKNGITVLNTPGTVDRGYSGEIKVILINLSNENFIINHGDRIAQAVVSPVISGRWANLIKVDNLTKTEGVMVVLVQQE